MVKFDTYIQSLCYISLIGSNLRHLPNTEQLFMPNTDFECKIKATILKTAAILNKWEISIRSIARFT